MNTVFIILLSIICLLSAANFIYQFLRKPADITPLIQGLQESVRQQADSVTRTTREEIVQNRREIVQQSKDNRQELSQSICQFGTQQKEIFDLVNRQVGKMMSDNERRFETLHRSTSDSFELIRKRVDEKLTSIQQDNNDNMEKIRATVDEKLHKTLEERLGRSFQIVSEHLEKVQMGLGEMRNLAEGVGDLKKVLSNVKTRGILGEIQLLNIIEEIMTTDQYGVNIATVPGCDCRVEVAVKLPGSKGDEKVVHLPIDSKFPMDKYQYLLDAYEEGDAQKIQNCRKDLQRALLTAAKDIKTKYVAPPHTTDFAIMFLPVEGLYAEVSRQPDLLYRLKSEFQILVVGPSNLSAFLSSLQMGFRTLAIEKRSSEVWSLLGEIKTEFHKFGDALDKVHKKLQEANNVIDRAGVRRRAVQRRLNKVEELPSAEQLKINSVL